MCAHSALRSTLVSLVFPVAPFAWVLGSGAAATQDAAALTPFRIMRSELDITPQPQRVADPAQLLQKAQRVRAASRSEPASSHDEDVAAQQRRAAQAVEEVQRIRLGSQQLGQQQAAAGNASGPPALVHKEVAKGPVQAMKANIRALREKMKQAATQTKRAARRGDDADDADDTGEDLTTPAPLAETSTPSADPDADDEGEGATTLAPIAETPTTSADPDAGNEGEDATTPAPITETAATSADPGADLLRPVCEHPLPLVGPGTMQVVPDTSISASSYLYSARKHGKDEMFRSRLHSSSAWTPDETATPPISPPSFIQWDLGGIKYITQLWLQGHAGQAWWVTNFTLTYSVDALHWEEPEDVFQGCVGQDDISKVVFDTPFQARYVRLHPMGANERPSVRADLVGCAVMDLTAEARCQTRQDFTTMDGVKVNVTASTAGFDADLGHNSRIVSSASGWISKQEGAALHQWLQWDLGKPMLIEKIRTAGIMNQQLWVTGYDFAYSMDGYAWSWYDEDIQGNTDDTSTVEKRLGRSVEARYARIYPTRWNGDAGFGLRAQLEGCAAPPREIQAKCTPQDYGPLIGGAASPAIADSAIATSSQEAPDGDTASQSAGQQSWCSRIDCKGDSWTANATDKKQWIIFDLGKLSQVGKIETRGRHNMEEWVTAYTLSYSSDGTTWVDLGHVHTGNEDRVTKKTNRIEPPLTARFVRVNPTEWHSKISMRVELYGCSAPKQAVCTYSRLVGSRADQRIKDRAITASSYFDDMEEYGARGHMWRARMDNTKDNAWKPANMDIEPWIQFDFGSPRIISKVITARSGIADASLEQITTFKLNYSNAGSVWTTLGDDFNATGNSGATEITNEIVPPITASVVRLLPLQLVGDLTLRAEFMGCAGSPNDDTGANMIQPLSEKSWTLKTSLAFAREVINMERQALCKNKEEILDPELVAGSAQVQVAMETVVTMTLRFTGGNEHTAKVKWADFGESSPLRSAALVQVQQQFPGTRLIGSIGWLVLSKEACKLEELETDAAAAKASLMEQHAQARPLPFASSVLLERELKEYSDAMRRRDADREAGRDARTKGPVHVASKPPRYAHVSALSTGAAPASSPNDDPNDFPTFNDQLLPSFSWRSTKPSCFNYVHNQGSCGSGYMFAAVDSISDRNCIKENVCTPEPLSVMMALQCEDSGRMCAGGTAAAAFDTAKQGGLHFESAWPYEPDCLSRHPCQRGGLCNQDLGRPTLASRCAAEDTAQQSMFLQDEARNIETFEDALLVTEKLCQTTAEPQQCNHWARARFSERGLTMRFDLSDDRTWCSDSLKRFGDFLGGGQSSSPRQSPPVLLEMGMWPFAASVADPDATNVLDPDNAPIPAPKGEATTHAASAVEVPAAAAAAASSAGPTLAAAAEAAAPAASDAVQRTAQQQKGATGSVVHADAARLGARHEDSVHTVAKAPSVAQAAETAASAKSNQSTDLSAGAVVTAKSSPQTNATAASVARGSGEAVVDAMPIPGTLAHRSALAAPVKAHAATQPNGTLSEAGVQPGASPAQTPPGVRAHAPQVAAVVDVMPTSGTPAHPGVQADSVTTVAVPISPTSKAAASVVQAADVVDALPMSGDADPRMTVAAPANATSSVPSIQKDAAPAPASLTKAAVAADSANAQVLQAALAAVHSNATTSSAIEVATAVMALLNAMNASHAGVATTTAAPAQQETTVQAAVVVDEAPVTATGSPPDVMQLVVPASVDKNVAGNQATKARAQSYLRKKGCAKLTQKPSRAQVCSRATCSMEAAAFHLSGYHYVVKSVEAFKLELAQRGPFYTSFTVMEDFMSFFAQFPTRAYTHAWGESLGAHAATLLGWYTNCRLRPTTTAQAAAGAEIPEGVSRSGAAEEPGLFSSKLDEALGHLPDPPAQPGSYSRTGHRYGTLTADCWELRNSFGEDWADGGYFRMEINTLVGPLGLAGVAADV